MQFVYDDSMSVGVSAIDKQHRDLLERISRFADYLNQGYTESLLASINYLADYVIDHFSNEERYMMKYFYPEFKSHRDEHTKYVNVIYDFKWRVKNGERSEQFANDVKRELGEWFVHHIKNTDMKLGDYLKNVKQDM